MGSDITLIMGVASFAGGLISLYGAVVRKRYAAERDFGHLKRSYENLSSNVEALTRFQDDRFDDVDKTLMEIRLQQQTLISLLGSSSQIFKDE